MKIKTFTLCSLFLFALFTVSFTANAQDVLPAIYSPGFEEDDFADFWEDWDNSSINEDADYVHDGARSLLVTSAGGGTGQFIENFTPETEISLLAWAKSDADFSSEAYIGFYFDDEEVKSALDAVHSGAWKQLCVTATIPATTAELYVYYWFDGDENGANTYVDDFTVEWGDVCQYMGIDKDARLSRSINVYPNPASGPIQISVGKENFSSSSLHIFDLSGKMVYRNDLLNGERNISLDISTFAAGMYYGVLDSDNGKLGFKIFKR